jgi:hypothetical protein
MRRTAAISLYGETDWYVNVVDATTNSAKAHGRQSSTHDNARGEDNEEG